VSEEKIEKILNERKQAIMESFKQSLEAITRDYVMRFESEVEKLKESAKIQLPPPLNVIDVLSNGGYVKSKILNFEYATELYLDNVFDWGYARPTLKRGKYRITLIVERLSENE